jgi:hypothetical protein
MIALIVFVCLIVALMSALAGYYISAEKGRGGFEGLCFGFFFGLFGLLLTVLMPEPPFRAKPLWSFGSVMASIGTCLSVLILIAFLEGGGAIATYKIATEAPAAVAKSAQPAVQFGPPTSDPTVPYLIGALGIAAAVMIFVSVLAPRRKSR